MTYEKPYIAVAPMMDWTDRHCRTFHRLIAPHLHLYTEMVTTGALIYGARDRFLRFSQAEQPVILQLGGCDPADLALCARMGEEYGYSGINLNCGCPSDRVQNGRFGACLMKEPARVADCVAAMIDAVSIPVSVKCRIGVDDCDDFSFLNSFIEDVSQAGCKDFIVHARKAWLKGLSPKENRQIPPLRYDIVREIKRLHPELNIVVNGGIKTVEDIRKHLNAENSPFMERDQGGSVECTAFASPPDTPTQPSPSRGKEYYGFDGVMIGREAYQNPYFLAEIERTFFDNDKILPRETVAQAMIPYIEEQGRQHGTPAKSITRHMIGLFHGQPGGRKWRRALSEQRSIGEALAEMGQAPLKQTA